MLRKRSRATTSKQALMADCGSLPSPTDKYRRPTSSFFSSPRLFTGFASKGFSDTEAAMSPTSTLDSKPFSAFRNPFWCDPNTPKTPEPDHKRHWEKLDSRPVGLGIVDALKDEKSDPRISKADSRMVLFGSQLKIQIPSLPASVLSPVESPKSPGDFGIKTRNCLLGSSSRSLSRSPMKNSASGSANSSVEALQSPRVFTGCLSATEMELSEDYTCVIAHGPNPRTTHIFDDCIVESCCGALGYSATRKENGLLPDRSSYPSESFLSFCYACKKNLGQGKDIYMYRGEKAFCSSECRYQEILLEEEMEKQESDDVYGACS
ncbi:FCS-Like Zinc finger 8 [Malania oleifera]|uniref:FCS-Like Zinc finger 8 n=1 Tax=Malania oleifera TaxID=397392 RepID=UPI0025AE440E|nr:FCS-Like Zinc finger 8 [Malania oleifera]XP_057958142.1 FCS-Like Zinc finger 8 [Malania oleifera]XP_057958143.1 FCS-Like Zinc finger 8 [Malania oleifera]